MWCLKPKSNDRNIVWSYMLRAFGHTVATCCDMLGVVDSYLAIFKLELFAKGCPEACNMLRPTKMRHVALKS